MQKILVLGKALWDVVLKTDFKITKDKFCFNFREKVLVKKISQGPGGGAINVSFSLKKLGFAPLPLVVLGKDSMADSIREGLKAEKISTELCSSSKVDTGISIIISNQEGSHIALIYPGANRRIKKEDFETSLLEKARWWFILSWGNNDKEIADFIADKKEELGCHLAFNPGGIQLENIKNIKNLLQVSDIIFVNEKELEMLLARKVTRTKKNLRQAMIEAVGLGPKIIVVTLGRFGSFVYDGGYFYSAPIHPGKRVDSLGAGDAYSSAFLAYFLKTGKIEKAILAGTINSSSVVSAKGAIAGQLPINELEIKIKESKIKVVKTKII